MPLTLPQSLSLNELAIQRSSTSAVSHSTPTTEWRSRPYRYSKRSHCVTLVQGRHEFIKISSDPRIPIHKITSPDLLATWAASEAYYRLIDFITSLNTACTNTKNSSQCSVSPQTQSLLTVLDTLESWIDCIPPHEGNQRFGNTAFREWMQKVKDESTELHNILLPKDLHRYIPEIQVYFTGGFGDFTRIDYGIFLVTPRYLVF